MPNPTHHDNSHQQPDDPHTTTTSASGDVRRFLVPELAGDIAAATALIEDALYELAYRAEDDPDIDLPAALGRAAADAIGDIRRAINNATAHALYAPDGRYEHEPLAIVELPAPTIDIFGAAVNELARTPQRVADELIIDVLDDHTNRPRGRQHVIEIAARLHRLCTLEWSNDHTLIAGRLNDAANSTTRTVLTVNEEAGYNRIRDSIVAVWDDHDPLARWAY